MNLINLKMISLARMILFWDGEIIHMMLFLYVLTVYFGTVRTQNWYKDYKIQFRLHHWIGLVE
jgi:hypothetical protein